MSEIRSQATPARDELAGEIGLEIMEVVVDLTGGYKPDGERDHNRIEKGARAILALLKPRTVNSATELEALAEGSVILTGGVASIALTDLNQPVRVWDAGHGAQCTTDRLTFPATVLFAPGDAG